MNCMSTSGVSTSRLISGELKTEQSDCLQCILCEQPLFGLAARARPSVQLNEINQNLP